MNWAELGGGNSVWAYEGIIGYAWSAPADGYVTNALHKYYNSSALAHFFTTDYDEIENGAGGYLYEGPGFYVFGAEALPATAATVVPLSGSALNSTRDRTSYVFAAGTFNDSTIVVHTQKFSYQLPAMTGYVSASSATASNGLLYVGHAFELTGSTNSGTSLVTSASAFPITVEYTDVEIAGIWEGSLGLYYWNGSQWILANNSQVDTTANQVTATTNQLGIWAVLGKQEYSLFLPVIRRQ